jgi:transposase
MLNLSKKTTKKSTTSPKKPKDSQKKPKDSQKKSKKLQDCKVNELPVLQPNACGIDVGAESIFVCVPHDRDPEPIREFLAFTEDLHHAAKWMKQCGVTSVAMESTAFYWIPVFEILIQYDFEIKLVNACHAKNVPGRKTDVSDARWIQHLHSVGLLSGSFRPDDEVVKLRSMVRHRQKLIQNAADQLNYVQMALELLNIKLQHVVSDISGKTGSQIIGAILTGVCDPNILAQFRDPRCRNSSEIIAKSLEGNWREEHLLSLKHAWQSYLFIHDQVLECEGKIEKWMERVQKQDVVPNEMPDPEKKIKGSTKKIYNQSPYVFDLRAQLHKWAGVDLCVIPGINENLAIKILAETGTDMTQWASTKHFTSWLSVCPGNKISGGKRLSGKTRPSKNRVREALGMAAQALSRCDSYLGAYYRRMRGRFDGKKANRAAAHKLARIIYTMLKEKKEYKNLSAADFDKVHKERTLNSLQKKAQTFGYKLVPISEVAQ